MITVKLERREYALILEVIQDCIFDLNHNPSYTQVKDSDRKIYQEYAKSLKKLFNKLTKSETFEVKKMREPTKLQLTDECLNNALFVAEDESGCRITFDNPQSALGFCKRIKCHKIFVYTKKFLSEMFSPERFFKAVMLDALTENVNSDDISRYFENHNIHGILKTIRVTS